MLPSVAHRDGILFVHNDSILKEPSLTRTSFYRNEAQIHSQSPDNSDSLRMDLQKNWTVIDDRNNLRYAVGSQIIILDDIEYPLTEPYNPITDDYRQFIILSKSEVEKPQISTVAD